MDTKVLSWNINGLDLDTFSGIVALLLERKPHLLFLNETKKPKVVMKAFFDKIPGHSYILNPHSPAKWHGVAVLIRGDVKYKQIFLEMKCGARKESDKGSTATDGRVIALDLGEFFVVGTYVPNAGSDKKKPLKNIGYRLEWDACLHSELNRLRTVKGVLWIGDINVAPDEIDVTHPEQMGLLGGFSKQERKSHKKFMEGGVWYDVFRFQNPDLEAFSWFGGMRVMAMRLDACMASKELMPFVIDSFIDEDHPPTSDHVPIGITIRCEKSQVPDEEKKNMKDPKFQEKGAIAGSVSEKDKEKEAKGDKTKDQTQTTVQKAKTKPRKIIILKS